MLHPFHFQPWQGWKPHQLPGGIHSPWNPNPPVDMGCFSPSLLGEQCPLWVWLSMIYLPWGWGQTGRHSNAVVRASKCLSWAWHLPVSFQIRIPLELHNNISESFSDIFPELEHAELSPKTSTHQSPRNVCKLVQQQVLQLLVQN